MRELTLPVERPVLRINGEPFELRMNDLELYLRVDGFLRKLAAVPPESRTATQVMEELAEALALLEEMLGENAAARISGGHPVRLPLALEWLAHIAREAAEHYAELVTR